MLECLRYERSSIPLGMVLQKAHHFTEDGGLDAPILQECRSGQCVTDPRPL